VIAGRAARRALAGDDRLDCRVARSTTDSSPNAPASITMPGPSDKARTSSARSTPTSVNRENAA
jgi:hypothetical protein